MRRKRLLLFYSFLFSCFSRIKPYLSTKHSLPSFKVTASLSFTLILWFEVPGKNGEKGPEKCRLHFGESLFSKSLPLLLISVESKKTVSDIRREEQTSPSSPSLSFLVSLSLFPSNMKSWECPSSSFWAEEGSVCRDWREEVICLSESGPIKFKADREERERDTKYRKRWRSSFSPGCYQREKQREKRREDCVPAILFLCSNASCVGLPSASLPDISLFVSISRRQVKTNRGKHVKILRTSLILCPFHSSLCRYLNRVPSLPLL